MRDGLHLGRLVEGDADALVPTSELTTHALCVGMTGSGKTGLCAVLLEELLDRGIPVIAIDPKGDLGNLALTLDPSRPEEFVPWIDAEQAAREGSSAAARAQEAATRLSDGLAASGRTLEELRAHKAGFVARILTPGATFGTPVDVVGRLVPPPPGSDEERAEAIDAQLAAILALVKVDAGPTSRELVLLHTIVAGSFAEGKALELGALVRLVAEPPFDVMGALPLETVYPKKERLDLAMKLNGLVASPSLAAWRQGLPMDVDAWLRAPDGRPCLTVFSTAHLSDDERLFATALLLERVLSWTRRQKGTGELRAVLYVDEIYGYFPPHPYDPPTKRPLLTLLKQARAFGLGVVLATQNPIDLDYKGLSNIGSWFVGRLQTDQDKARIRDGLQGAASAAGQTLADVERLLAGVQKRVFLWHSIHRGAPTLLRTRQAFSYLRGPLSREELARLSTPVAAAVAAPAAAAVAVAAPALPPTLGIPPELGPVFSQTPGPAAPHLLVRLAVRWRVGRVATDERTVTLAFPLPPAAAPGEALEATPRLVPEGSLQEQPPAGFSPLPAPGWLAETTPAQLLKVVKARLPGKLEAELFYDEAAKLLSAPGEPLETFVARVHAQQAEGKAAKSVLGKLGKKREALGKAQLQLQEAQRQKTASVAGAVFDNLGLVFGRKRTVSGVGKVLGADAKADALEEKVAALRQECEALEAELAGASAVDPARFAREKLQPAAKDLSILRVAIALLP